MFVRDINQKLQAFFRHKREGPARELDAIYVRTPVGKEFVEICCCNRIVIWAPDFRESLPPWFRRQSVGWEEVEGGLVRDSAARGHPGN